MWREAEEKGLSDVQGECLVAQVGEDMDAGGVTAHGKNLCKEDESFLYSGPSTHTMFVLEA